MSQLNSLEKPSASTEAPLDLLRLDALLTSITSAFAASAEHYDRSAEFPAANFALLHRHGLLALTVPTVQGGPGGRLTEARQVISAVARGEPSTALILAMQYVQHATIQNNPNWSASVKTKVAKDAIEHGALINALRVEPELGTPMRGGLPSTTAHRVTDGWIINGSKIFSTGIEGLTWLAVWAKSSDSEPLVGTWLVNRNTPGVSIVKEWDHLGLRASSSHKVVFENVRVPLDHAVDINPLGTPPNGFNTISLWMQVLVSSIYDAIARNARDWFVQWAKSRKPSNLPGGLADLPHFQVALGEVEALLLVNSTLLDAAEHFQPHEHGLLKNQVTGNAIRVVERLLELSGNPGLTRTNPLERYYRDVLCGRVHSPQSDTALGTAGRVAFAGGHGK